ncbi:hypothetical protein BC937DRAFT_88439 [Endogone sp. FLAS-F59071]|nr:hypothetical protein BC937DRAFT_88439 [Endogone sp. FLAS-F59071]|eukprot:RUS22563.1 hypothetical protein BC937DRAFT_88439 [Endogone sp. FLAS-F59071]
MANLLQTMGSKIKSTEKESVQCQKDSASVHTPEDSNVVDLATLAYLLNLDRFSKATDQHEALLINTRLAALAVAARHLDSLPGTYDSLHRLFKNDQKSDFARVYNYSLDLWDCIVERTLINPYPRTGFLEFLTWGSQQIVAEFLTLIRNNPDYILAAIRRRSDVELESLVFGHRYPLHNEDHPHYRTNITNSPIAHLLLTTLHAQLPTFSAERTLHRTLWTRIFVTLLSEQRAEKFIIEALDHYIHHLWDLDLLEPTKRRLELSLLNILRRGERILGQLISEEPDDYFGSSSYTVHNSSSPPANPVVRASIHISASISSPPSISKRVHPPVPSPSNSGRSVLSPIPSPSTPASSASHSGSSHKVDSFFDNACIEILSVLDDPATQMIPPCLVELVQGILKELPEDLQNYAKGVLTVKFFFSKFVGRFVMYPEYYGLLEDYYISEAQRQRVLVATHNRLYKHVMESTKVVPSWGRRTAFMDPRIRELVGKVVARFNPDSPAQAPAASSTAFPNASPSPYPSSSLHSNVTPTLLVCPSDISSLFHFLCPEAKPATEPVPAATSPGRRGRPLANRANANANATATAAINATTIAASAPTTKTPFDLSSSVSSTSSTLSRFSTTSVGTMNASSYSSEGTHNIEKQYAQQTKEVRNISPSISSTVPTEDEAELLAHLGDHPIYAKMQKVVEELRRHVSTSVVTTENGTAVWRSSVHPMSEPWALLYVSRDGMKVALTEAEAQVERRADGEIAPRRQRRVVFTGLNVAAESKECNTAQTDAATDDDAGWSAEASADDEGDLSEEERIIGKALFAILREMELASGAAGIPMMNGLDSNRTFIGGNAFIPISPPSAHSMLNRLSMHGRLPAVDQVVALPLREAVSIAELFQQAIQVSQAKNDHAAALSYHHAATVFSHLQRRHMRTQDMPSEGLAATEAEYDAVLLGRFAGPLQRRALGRQVRSQRRQSSQVYLHDWHTRMSGALQAKKKVFEALRLRMFYAAARNIAGTNSGNASPTMGQRGWDRLAGVVGQCFGEADAHVLWASNTKRAQSGGKEQRPPMRRNSEIVGAVIVPSPSSSMTTISTTQAAAEENRGCLRTRRTSIGTLAGIVGVKKTATEEKVPLSSKVKATATFSKSSSTAVGMLECAICHKLQCTCNKRPSKTPVAQAQQANKRFSQQQPSVEVEKKPLDQSQKEQVARWLRERGVHNFLPGEERFHYFCMEVEIFKGVMFKDVWNDVLFMREARAFGLLPPEESTSGSSSAIITVPEAETFGRRSLEMALPGFGNQFQQSSKKNPNHRRESSGSSNSSLFGSSPLFSSTFGNTAAHVHHSHHHHLHRHDHSAAATQQNLPGYGGVPSSPYSGYGGSSPATSSAYFSNTMSLSPLSTPMSPPMSPFAFQTVPANMSSSSTSISSMATSPTNTQSQMDEFSMMLELQLTGLICSEFGAGVMNEAGCETDRWFEEFLAQMEDVQDEELDFDVSPDVWGDDLFGVETARPTLPRRKKSVASTSSLSAKPSLSSLSRTLVQSKANAYPLLKSYKELMRLFALHPSPYQKLHTLFALELLIVASLTYDMIPALPRSGTSTPPTPMASIPDNSHSRSTSHASSSTAASINSSSSVSLSSLSSASTETNSPGTDAIVNEIERLFRSSFIRPRNLVRDLQMISSFVPATILDLRDEGKAFWDMSLAVMSLKKQVVERIVERGMGCIEGDSKERKGGSTPLSTPTPSRPSSKDASAGKVDDEHAAKLQMEAVRLFAIAAKESHPGAQRELAILHLSDPSLPDTTLPPASLPAPAATLPLPTLKAEESSDPTKFNAKSVAAALHWFALAAAQGDEFSRTFLEHREGGAMGGVVGVF